MVLGGRGCDGSQNVDGVGDIQRKGVCGGRVRWCWGEGAVMGVRMWTERVIFSVRECAEGGCGGAGGKGL